jgi:hypothetical protein
MDIERRRRQFSIRTVFGESPDPEPQPGKKQERKLDPETAGLIRGFILVTGAFLTIALLLIWLKYYPTTPDLPAIPSTGEYERLLAADEAKLNNYSWVNQRSGIVRIPIKEAMSILAERGLPARQLDEGEGEGEAGAMTEEEPMSGEEGGDVQSSPEGEEDGASSESEGESESSESSEGAESSEGEEAEATPAAEE